MMPKPTSDPAVVRRLRHRVGVAAGAVVLWPVLLYAILGTEPFTAPISVTVCVVVMLYLSFEVAPLSVYKGPVSEYDNSDAVYERGVQVSTVAFAVATLLLSQKDDGLATLVAAPIFLSLLFCTISAVPSAVAPCRGVGALERSPKGRSVLRRGPPVSLGGVLSRRTPQHATPGGAAEQRRSRSGSFGSAVLQVRQ